MTGVNVNNVDVCKSFHSAPESASASAGRSTGVNVDKSFHSAPEAAASGRSAQRLSSSRRGGGGGGSPSSSTNGGSDSGHIRRPSLSETFYAHKKVGTGGGRGSGGSSTSRRANTIGPAAAAAASNEASPSTSDSEVENLSAPVAAAATFDRTSSALASSTAPVDRRAFLRGLKQRRDSDKAAAMADIATLAAATIDSADEHDDDAAAPDIKLKISSVSSASSDRIIRPRRPSAAGSSSVGSAAGASSAGASRRQSCGAAVSAAAGASSSAAPPPEQPAEARQQHARHRSGGRIVLAHARRSSGAIGCGRGNGIINTNSGKPLLLPHDSFRAASSSQGSLDLKDLQSSDCDSRTSTTDEMGESVGMMMNDSVGMSMFHDSVGMSMLHDSVGSFGSNALRTCSAAASAPRSRRSSTLSETLGASVVQLVWDEEEGEESDDDMEGSIGDGDIKGLDDHDRSGGGGRGRNARTRAGAPESFDISDFNKGEEHRHEQRPAERHHQRRRREDKEEEQRRRASDTGIAGKTAVDGRVVAVASRRRRSSSGGTHTHTAAAAGFSHKSLDEYAARVDEADRIRAEARRFRRELAEQKSGAAAAKRAPSNSCA